MRQVVLDTETTGLDPAQGHRIIEIGAVELIYRRATGNRYHQYLQPDREIDAGALEVHGISAEFLADKPRFSEVVEDFINFIKDAELIIHNAPFDIGFLDAELQGLGPSWGQITDHCTFVDALVLARQLHPGQSCSLDALCKRYNIDNSQRELHGALLDAEILADVYLTMTGGQAALSLGGAESQPGLRPSAVRRVDPNRPRLRVIPASPQELEAHGRRLLAIGKESGRCLWKELEEGATEPDSAGSTGVLPG
jgi:DNA polymerase-3 subunit epsilon